MSDKLELMLEAERRGILPAEQQQLLDEARRRGLVDQGGNFASAMQGEDFAGPPESLFRADSPFMATTKSGPGVMLSAAARDMFGGPKAAAQYLAEKTGGQVIALGDGEPGLQLPDGKVYRLNDQGVDMTDVANFTGKALSFTPAARVASMAPTLTGKMALGGVASAATEGAEQYATGADIDPLAIGMAGAGGSFGELIAPTIGRIFAGAKGARLPRAEAVNRARAALGERGEQLPPEVAEQVGRRLDEIARGGKPDDLIGEAEFGFQYTQGQRTGDVKQLMREERLMQSEDMQQVGRQNVEAAQRAVDNLSRQMAGGEVDTATGAVSRATDLVRNEHAALKGRVRQAYDEFGKAEASVPSDVIQRLPERIGRALENTHISERTTPKAMDALTLVDNAFGAGFKEGGLPNLSAQRIEQIRQQLRSIKGIDPADKRAVNIVIREMDGWLDDTVEQGLIQGDQRAIDLIKQARQLNTDLAKRFGVAGNDKADKIVGRMLSRNATADELAQTIYGLGQVSQPMATRALQRIQQAMATNKQAPEVWDQLRAQVLRAATRGSNDSPLGIQAIHSNLKKLLVHRPELMRTLFKPGELQTVQRLTAAMEPLLRTVDNRSSGTTERLMRMMTPYLTANPFLRVVFDPQPVVDAIQKSAVRRSLAPLAPPRPGLVPATTAAGFGLAAPYLNPQK